jgi:hypothetical protein
MARKQRLDPNTMPMSRQLTTPGVFLVRMAVFLALVGFIVAIILPTLLVSFQTNPALNGLIIAVLAFGVLYAFGQVLRLYREIRWVNSFRIADPGLAMEHRPVLLAPMATMLRDRTGALSLSTAAMRSFMDSIGSRLDEARDTGRYMVGLLVFLGLLGTFWGLLDTIQSVGRTIAALDTKASETAMVFEELKTGLSAPLRGMGTAFSSSLLGLSGSLILGFLELQASQAHNRFYNELEEWLSGITELTPGTAGGEAANRQLYTALYDVQRTIAELADRMQAGGGAPGSAASSEAMRELAQGVNQLVGQMRAEQTVIRQWVDEQSIQGQQLAKVLEDLARGLPRRSA